MILRPFLLFLFYENRVVFVGAAFASKNLNLRCRKEKKRPSSSMQLMGWIHSSIAAGKTQTADCGSTL
jgi:hypothetical protein